MFRGARGDGTLRVRGGLLGRNEATERQKPRYAIQLLVAITRLIPCTLACVSSGIKNSAKYRPPFSFPISLRAVVLIFSLAPPPSCPLGPEVALTASIKRV